MIRCTENFKAPGSEEQQGHPPQTDSDYNKHLQHRVSDVHRGWRRGREKDRQRKRQKGDQSGRDKLDECGSESENVGERGKGDRHRREGKTARDGLNTQHFWSLQNKAPESVTFPLFLWC